MAESKPISETATDGCDSVMAEEERIMPQEAHGVFLPPAEVGVSRSGDTETKTLVSPHSHTEKTHHAATTD